MSQKIAIIGAGLSGLAAAHRLSGHDFEIQIFEKSKGVSGRAASRSKVGCRYDHGANYFKVNCNEIAQLLFEDLSTDDLCRIVGDIHTFDHHGKVSQGDPKQNAVAKWSYRSGISTLGKMIVESSGLEVTGSSRITSMCRSQNTWSLTNEGGEIFEDFDAILLTPPGPQTNEIIAASDFDPAPRSGIISELKKAKYHSQFSVALNYLGNYFLPNDAYALINSDREHPIAWVSLENRKAGHVPPEETLFIVQMSPQWTIDHYDDSRETLVSECSRLLAELITSQLPQPNWSDTQRWKFAHPYSAADANAMRRTSTIGLFFAGDSFVGKGRIPETIETGFNAAADILEFLETP